MTRHWTEDAYWRGGDEEYMRLKEACGGKLTLDLDKIEEAIYNGQGPAYKLLQAMVSVNELEGMDGFRGAPRLVLQLLSKLAQLKGIGDTPLKSIE